MLKSVCEKDFLTNIMHPKGNQVMNIVFNCYPNGLKKALTMSYDDGVIHDRRLVEIFNRYGIKGTFHINSGLLNSGSRLAADEIAELYRGHEIACHTDTHPFPEALPRECLINQVYGDRRKLEAIAGYPVRGMSYPFGRFNDEVIDTMRALGIEYSRTTVSTNGFAVPTDFMRWNPTTHHRGDLGKLLEAFANPPRRIPNLMLFYVWGHSYEFNDNNNWEIIEDFCEKVSKLDNVWFATNIEIYDYITALKALRFSADCTIVYNPSAITCWFTADGKEYAVNPGQTLKLD